MRGEGEGEEWRKGRSGGAGRGLVGEGGGEEGDEWGGRRGSRMV